MKAASPLDLAISSIVAYELEYGTRKGGSPHRRAVLEGVLSNPLDLLIAGTAVSRGAALVTNNFAEFSRIRGFVFRTGAGRPGFPPDAARQVAIGLLT